MTAPSRRCSPKGSTSTPSPCPAAAAFLSGLTTGIAFTTPAWGKLRKLDFDGRLALIQDEDERAKLIEDAKKHPQVEQAAKNFYWLGDEERPQYARDAGESLYSQAKAAGRHPVELWLDKMLETDGKALFHVRFFNHDLETLKGFLTTDWVLPGIGDAGAHVSQIMDSGWTSFLLAHWHRENDLFTIQEAVRRMTSALGTSDRLQRPGHAQARHEGRRERHRHRPSGRTAAGAGA